MYKVDVYAEANAVYIVQVLVGSEGPGRLIHQTNKAAAASSLIAPRVVSRTLLEAIKDYYCDCFFSIKKKKNLHSQKL